MRVVCNFNTVLRQVWDVKSSEEVCTYFDKRLGEGQDESVKELAQDKAKQEKQASVDA